MLDLELFEQIELNIELIRNITRVERNALQTDVLINSVSLVAPS